MSYDMHGLAPIQLKEFALQLGIGPNRSTTMRIYARDRHRAECVRSWTFPGLTLSASELEDVLSDLSRRISTYLVTTSGVQLTLPPEG